MRLLIDTNRYSDADRGDSAIIERFEQAAELWLSLVVLGELRYGFAAGGKRSENEANLREFLAMPQVRLLSIDEETTLYYASVNADLRERGMPIPTNDMWIAAQALQHNLTLDSRDEHFRRVPGLRLVDNK